MPRLRYPEMRMELLGYLRKLKDLKYQMKAWVNHDFPADVQYDHLDLAIHFILMIRILAVMLVDRKSTRLNSSHTVISYAVFCLKKKKILDEYTIIPVPVIVLVIEATSFLGAKIGRLVDHYE